MEPANVNRETLFSDWFGIDPEVLDALGTFDPYLVLDSPLGIDPKLLESASEPELADAYPQMLQRFTNIFSLLEKSESEGDHFWRAADRLMRFPEFKGVSLGFSESRSDGSGWGSIIRTQVLRSASTIIKVGLHAPEFFELLALFESRIGADRIGDMVGTILIPQLCAYTKRISDKLGIPTRAFRIEGVSYELPFWTNIEKQDWYVILVPWSILSDLPVGLDRSAISGVADHNDEMREHLNKRIGKHWARVVRERSRTAKAVTKDAFFSNPAGFEEYIAYYRSQKGNAYDFKGDPKAMRLVQDALRISDTDIQQLHLDPVNTAEAAYEAVHKIVMHFKHSVEQNRLSRVFFVGTKPRKELDVQPVFQAIAAAHCEYNGLDISPEANAGRGPVDFKFSNGNRAKVLVELKLSGNPNLAHGFKTQVEIYKNAENTDKAIYLVINNGEGERNLERLDEAVAEAKEEARKTGKRIPEVVIVDARPKPSASKA